MKTITNKDRAHLIHSVLSETFDPKFLELNRELVADVKAKLQAAHPKYYEALDNAEISQYLAKGSIEGFRSGDIALTRPIDYSEPVGAVMVGRNLRHNNAQHLGDINVIAPTSCQRYQLAHEHECQKYFKLLNAMLEARQLLTITLNAYRSREKFETDFPDLARHLPPAPVKIQLPVLNPVGTIKQLKKLGIK